MRRENEEEVGRKVVINSDSEDEEVMKPKEDAGSDQEEERPRKPLADSDDDEEEDEKPGMVMLELQKHCNNGGSDQFCLVKQTPWHAVQFLQTKTGGNQFNFGKKIGK